LFKKLQESFDIERLQRVEARCKKIQEIFNKKRSLGMEETMSAQINFKRRKSSSGQVLNKLDPIMLCPLGKKNTWKFIRPNGRISQILF
jgi:hypothetical protein